MSVAFASPDRVSPQSADRPRAGVAAPAVAEDVDDLVSRYLKPGMHVHFAATMSRPNALLYAVARVFGPRGARFTVSTTAIHSSAHALTLAGVVDKAITCFVGDTYPSPRPNPLYRDLSSGRPFVLEPWSLLSYTQRLIAGATGLPYHATGSLHGSDLMTGKEGSAFAVADPGRPGSAVTLVSAMRPDFTLVHGVCADRRGNVVICPPDGEGAWSALAARHGVLASVEAIVPDEVVDAHADRVLIPAERVVALAVAPYGAHPQSLRTADIGGVCGYLDDLPFIAEITEACAQPDSAAHWYRTWVGHVGGHTGYLERLGKQRLSDLAVAGGEARRSTDEPARAEQPAPGAARPSPATGPATAALTAAAASPADITDGDRVIILAARAVADRVESGGYTSLLAGIGGSHLAAWLAAALLRRRGVHVAVAAELGLYGFTPASGDVYLFSQRHVARATALAGIPEILGAVVAGRCLGVLAAGEVDRLGNLNTSFLGNGRYLTGSGGANDIASAADCLVVAAASPRRYVKQVAYVTSPGRRVLEAVCQFGRFDRAEPQAPLRLRTWLPPREGADDPHEAVARLTDWPDAVAEYTRERPIAAEELALLRRFDPEGIYR